MKKSGAKDFKLIIRFWRYLKPHKFLLGIGLLLLPLISLTQLAQPFLIKAMIDRVITQKDTSLLLPITLLFIGSLLCQYVFTYLQFITMQVLGQRSLRQLRQEIFEHIITRSGSFFDSHPVGQLVTRITNDVESLSEMFTSGIVSLIGDLVTLTAILIAMFILDARLALVAIFLLPILILGTTFFRVRLRRAYEEIRKWVSQMNIFLSEHLSGIEVIHLFHREPETEKEFSEINRKHYSSHLSSIIYDSSLYAFVEMLGSITMGAFIWVASGNLLQGIITFGVLVAFFELIQKFFTPLRDFSSKYSIMKTATVALDKIFHILDDQSIIPEAKSPYHLPKTPKSIEFDHVIFGYDPNNPVIKDISFTIEPGEIIAIVGPTGSGKTTIAKLLSRFYEPQKGTIKISGIDIRDLSLDELRHTVGVVHQDLFLFRDTVGRNIHLGNPDIGEDQTQFAAELVHASPFIETLPNKFEEEIVERGRNLSVGQKQLICFARALAYNPSILILDEATGSIDVHHEHLIQRALKKLLKDRTSIIIAHRLSTIRQANRIIVMHKGEIRETGTHESLLKQHGIYSRLHQLQFQI
ncbi:MAG TPA: ABC transporter ATP-binding protein [Bdellovibrionota bacterium]|nr:ABC transporter ATP-binding protein [Bdellovibrionota bacterium]